MSWLHQNEGAQVVKYTVVRPLHRMPLVSLHSLVRSWILTFLHAVPPVAPAALSPSWMWWQA
jgi:hypothetical protein